MEWWVEEHRFSYKEKVAPQGYWMPLVHRSETSPKESVFYCEIYDSKNRCIVRSMYSLPPGEESFSLEIRNKTRKELIRMALMSGINSMTEITDQLYREGKLP